MAGKGSNLATSPSWQTSRRAPNATLRLRRCARIAGVAWVLDLDGVVWLGDQALPGAADAVARLRAAGQRVVFATNNSSAVVAQQEAKLARFGIPAEGDLITSAMAGAALVEPGERVLVCGGPGVVEALEQRHALPVRDQTDVDAVMVGFHRDFDYERMRLAAEALRRGGRFIATNDDATYPTPEGPIPGGGAIAASVAYAAGQAPEVAGKPHQPMADLIRARTGEDDGIVVGDRPETDGAFAKTLGYRFGLVLTGVTKAGDLPVQPSPDLVADDLAALVDASL